MLTQRVAVAVAGVPIIFLLILAGHWPFAVAVAGALALAGAEFQHLRLAWTRAQTLAAALIIGALTLAAHTDRPVVWFVVAVLAALGAIAAFADGSSSEEPESERVRHLAWLALGVAYVGGLGLIIVLLRDAHDGRDWVYLALFSTFAVDTAAYFVGRTVGRHRLAPRISPKKTIEGFAGGWAGGFAAVLVLNYELGIRSGPASIVALGLLLPIAATIGDLFESALKRATGVKDASELIPGHGGALDRLDSLLFTFPLVYLFARWLA